MAKLHLPGIGNRSRTPSLAPRSGDQPIGIPADEARSLESHFQSSWYRSVFGSTMARLGAEQMSEFDFYLRVGARLGHDPNPGFSELLYRRDNQDVYKAILGHDGQFGYRHYLSFGRQEQRQLPSASEMTLTRSVVAQLDPIFIRETYSPDPSLYVSPFDFYLKRVSTDEISPSRDFSEEGYRRLNPDVDAGIRSGALLSGFAHFLDVLDRENRLIVSFDEYRKKARRQRLDREKEHLEANLPGITRTMALEVIDYFDFFSGRVNVQISPAEDEPGFLVIVPNFLPEILFGGYLAFFDFLDGIKTRFGAKLHLIVLNNLPEDLHKNNIWRMKLTSGRHLELFQKIDRLSSSRTLQVPANFGVISYAAETHYVAGQVAAKLGRLPVFFIQEYEPDFHPEGDQKSFAREAFRRPHLGIYNSEQLLRFFQVHTDLFDKMGSGYRYCHFENALEPLSVDRAKFIEMNKQKWIRKLIFYGRPEGHASRNQFATFVLGLREAIRDGVFSAEPWEFVGIGSLTYEGRVPLEEGLELEVLTKLPFTEYTELLLTGDVGVSFISTPHPGIVHFQMANMGLVTLTNVTDIRTQEWLSQQNANLIGVELRPSAIAEGLGRAVEQARNLEARADNALRTKSRTKSECLEPALELVKEAL